MFFHYILKKRKSKEVAIKLPKPPFFHVFVAKK